MKGTEVGGPVYFFNSKLVINSYWKGYLETSGSSVRFFISERHPSIILSRKDSLATRSAMSV